MLTPGEIEVNVEVNVEVNGMSMWVEGATAVLLKMKYG